MKRFAGKNMLPLAALAGMAAAALVWPSRSAADVVILSDGRRLEGIATTSTLVPDVILFTDHVNKLLQIPRLKIQQIIHEEESVSRLKIARAFAREGKYEQALEQIQEARRLAPTDTAIQEEEQNVLRAIAIRAAKQAEVKADESRGLLDKIRQAMLAHQFDKALPWFVMLEAETVPPEVRDEAVRLKIKFYDQWGDYRADRTDTLGAIECFEKVMDLDPNASDVYQKLMRLYERVAQPGANAGRVQKLQEFLETKVAEDPKDLDARLRLANLLYMKKDWDNALQQYLAVYRDGATSHPKEMSLTRVEARLRALLDGRQRKSAERHEYDLAIQQFREYQSLFPDVDTQPLVLYQYQKQAEQVDPKDDAARLELVRYCQKYGLEDYARKELATLLRNNPQNPEALKIMEAQARADLAEIATAFTTGYYAQISVLAAQFHEKYPVDRYPTFQGMNDAADDYVEKARNEMRTQVRDKRQRASELVQAGDQSFERAMTALYNYRDGAGTSYRTDSSGRRVEGITITAGSYKADAIMYFERAMRQYREALALDPALADSAKGDVRRKISDCERYLSLLKTQRINRLPPGARSARRFQPQYPTSPGYYPYVTPVQPYWPYGTYPYTTPVVPTPPPSR
jgi:tetratricopeptide (TPR) repeat protein